MQNDEFDKPATMPEMSAPSSGKDSASGSASMTTARSGMISTTLINLSTGWKLLFFRPVRLSDFRVSGDQVVVLCVVGMAVSIFGQWLGISGEAAFSDYGFLDNATYFLLLLTGAFMVARLLNDTGKFLAFAVVVLSIDVWTTAFSYGISPLGAAIIDEDSLILWSILIAVWVWFGALWIRASGVVFSSHKRAGVIAFSILIAVVILPVYWLPSNGYWYAAYSEDDLPPVVNVEDVYYRQAGLVREHIDALEGQRPGTVDLYHVGFGSDASQNVFRREIQHVRRILDDRFDTRGRSLTLINNQDTVTDVPVASATNLGYVLGGVAEKMDVDEDVLLLYLSSHGSPKAKLSVKFWPMRLNALDAVRLRQMLDDAGIRWRVVVVSACFSGSFIDALKDDQTLVITAAAVDRTSFGCANENEFTYFGEAYFKGALAKTYSFVDAFELAKEAVTKREKDEGLEPSNPAIQIGPDVEPKLDELEARLTRLEQSPG